MAADDCLGSADKRQRPEKVDSEEQPASVTIPPSNSDYNGNPDDGTEAEATTHNNNNSYFHHSSVEDSNQSPESKNNSKPTTPASRHTLSTGDAGDDDEDDDDDGDGGGDSVGEINKTLRRRAVHGGGGGDDDDDGDVVNSNTNTTTTTIITNSSRPVGFNAHSSRSSVEVSGNNTGTASEAASPSSQQQPSPPLPPPPPPPSSSSSSSRLCITPTTNTTTTSSTTPTTSSNNSNTSLKTYSSSNQNPAAPGPTVMNAREYAQVVRTWLWQYHQWNSMCAFSMMLPYYAMATFPYYAANSYPGFPPRTNSAPSSSSASPSSPPAYPLANANPAASSSGAGGPGNNNNNMQGAAAAAGGAGAAARGMNMRNAGHAGPHQTPQPAAARPAEQPLRATEYIIPSLWKRILAELVDFVLLFYIKLIVSVMVMKQMGYIDLDKYDLEYNWYVAMDDFDISKMFHFTSEMILFELLNRISITIVETMCLQRGIGVVGGSTPGKRLLGMKVVSCTEISDLGNGRIRVTPAQDIGLNSALLRSVLKNFTIAFFFPACLTVFFFDHNRAAYDVLAGSIVVQPIEEAGEV